MKKILGLVFILLLLGAGIWWLWQRQTPPVASKRLQVVATFYPLGYLAEQVGGDEVQVNTLIPIGVEPHDFTPTPQDILNTTAADLFIYNGGGLDTWAEEIPVEDFQNPNLFQVNASAVGVSTDPHVWLDPVLMQELVNNIRNGYSQLDPVHSVDYQYNAEQLIAKLQQVDTDYQTGLANCEIRQAIVAHDAFDYIADRYNLELLPIVGLSPNETPSAQTLAELTSLAEQYKIHYIFFEELTSPKLSEVLADAVGAETLVLSPLEGLSPEDQAAGADYFSIMERNLEYLRLALRCQ